MAAEWVGTKTQAAVGTASTLPGLGRIPRLAHRQCRDPPVGHEGQVVGHPVSRVDVGDPDAFEMRWPGK